MKSIKSIKILVVLICTLSILSGTLNKIFPSLLAFPDLTRLLSLTPHAIENWSLWQFFTHLLIYPAPSGIHILYLINLFFGIMILQRFGATIVHQKSEKSFLLYFFTCGIASGVAAYFTMKYSGHPSFYATPTSAIYSLLIATVFLFPRLDMMFLFTPSIKGKHLVPGLIGVILLINLSSADYTHFFATLAASMTAYLFNLFVWKTPSPYSFMQGFDNAIIKISSGKIFSLFQSTKLDHYTNNTKIFDINTGETVLSEEKFINACLEKIAREGKNSLTLYERIRLHRYSKKKQKSKS
ncbi:rhomboid family intramembrane serine protease [bacterium]|nr:rhomboid family intramembrane serine protease [bacterium]